MDLVNAKIVLRPDRLNWPLVQWHPAQLASYRFRILAVPSDVTGLQVHVGVPGSSADHYICPCVEHASGEWSGFAVPGCFPTAGETKYEVVATDADGHETFLGAGLVSIAERTTGNEVVATVSDEDGGTHILTAVNIDGEWSLHID